MTHPPFKHQCCSVPTPKSCLSVPISSPAIGSIHPLSPHMKLDTKNTPTPMSPRDSRHYFWCGNVQCVCVHVWRRRVAVERRRRRRRTSVRMYIYRCACARVSVCTCSCVWAWTWSSCKALVVLQGAVMSSSHLSTVFSHQRESHHSSSLCGEVCMCACRAKREVFWSWILSEPLPLKRLLSKFLYSTKGPEGS